VAATKALKRSGSTPGELSIELPHVGSIREVAAAVTLLGLALLVARRDALPTWGRARSN